MFFYIIIFQLADFPTVFPTRLSNTVHTLPYRQFRSFQYYVLFIRLTGWIDWISLSVLCFSNGSYFTHSVPDCICSQLYSQVSQFNLTKEISNNHFQISYLLLASQQNQSNCTTLWVFPRNYLARTAFNYALLCMCIVARRNFVF